MVRLVAFLLALGVLFGCGAAHATDQQPYIPTLSYQATTGEPDFADIRQSSDAAWTSLGDEAASFGYTDAVYWFKFDIPAVPRDRVLHLSYSLLDKVDVYFVEHDRITRQLQVGDKLPYEQRPVDHKDFVIALPTHNQQTVYLRVESTSSMRVPVSIWEHPEFLASQVTYNKATGLYFGVVICMAVYNLFGFFVSRERSFLYYSGYTVFMGLLMAGLDGSGFRYLWSDSLWIQDKSTPLFGSAVFIMAALFTSNLLELSEYSKRLERGLKGLSLIFLSLLLATFVLPYSILIKILLALAVPACVFLLGTGIYLWRRGHVYARIFTLAWGTFLFAVIGNSLGYLGLVDGSFIQRYAIMIGSGIEILLLSGVLAIRYNEERRAKLRAQADALARAEEAEASQAQLNEQLEDMVSERTFELEIAMRELQEVNSELEQKSSEDALTGIYNRRFLNRQLETEFRRAYRQESSLAVIMLDIDHFKQVNDTHGHLVGDQILQKLAKLLKSQLGRASDVVCRYGGEEFAIILPETDEDGAVEFAERLSERISGSLFNTDAGELSITVSMGIAVADSGDYAVAEQLLAAADSALYRAKNAGRNQVCVTEKEVL